MITGKLYLFRIYFYKHLNTKKIQFNYIENKGFCPKMYTYLTVSNRFKALNTGLVAQQLKTT